MFGVQVCIPYLPNLEGCLPDQLKDLRTIIVSINLRLVGV